MAGHELEDEEPREKPGSSGELVRLLVPNTKGSSGWRSARYAPLLPGVPPSAHAPAPYTSCTGLLDLLEGAPIYCKSLKSFLSS